MKLLLVTLLCMTFAVQSSETAPVTYSVIGSVSSKTQVAILFATLPYNIKKVPYKKKDNALIFKSSALKFRGEGTPILNLGDVALFSNKICVYRYTKKTYIEIEALITQYLDVIFYGLVSPNEFIVATPKWNLFQRDGTPHLLKEENVGISFDFPVSDKPDPNASAPWDGYFVYPGKSIPADAKTLVFEFKITASEGVQWNYKSDVYNTGCEYSKPSFRVYIAKGGIYADDETHCWWYKEGFILQNTPDVVKFSVPLDGIDWAGIYAVQGIDDLAGFRETVVGADWVGITFGGGCFYSHGINVTGGTAKFFLQRVYCEVP